MAIKAVQNFSGELPAVPVWKDGMIHYCHTPKELDKYTKAVEEGGMGWSTDYQYKSWPKLMSHPKFNSVSVANPEEEAKYAAKGYNYDHWTNEQPKKAARLRTERAGALRSNDGIRAAQIEEELSDMGFSLDGTQSSNGPESTLPAKYQMGGDPGQQLEVLALKEELAELKEIVKSLAPKRQRSARKPKTNPEPETA